MGDDRHGRRRRTTLWRLVTDRRQSTAQRPGSAADLKPVDRRTDLQPHMGAPHDMTDRDMDSAALQPGAPRALAGHEDHRR